MAKGNNQKLKLLYMAKFFAERTDDSHGLTVQDFIRKIKHYRVDKMLHIAVTDRRREGRDIFEKIDLPKYSNGLFGMYGGEEIGVTLLCENSMAGTIIYYATPPFSHFLCYSQIIFICTFLTDADSQGLLSDVSLQSDLPEHLCA